MPFQLAPREIERDFQWRSKYYHLTYKGYISSDRLLEVVAQATSVELVGWSMAQEDTTTTVNGVTYQGYQHTHLALIFASRLNLRGARVFDVVVLDGNGIPTGDVIHPHAQPKVTMVQMEQIFLQYHAGRKHSVQTGRLEFSEPVLHEYHLPQEFEFTRAIMLDCVGAPTLFEACIAGQVRPRTVSDIKALRDEAASDGAKQFRHIYTLDQFTTRLPDAMAVHVWGPTGVGKTKLVCATFKNPCFIKPFDSVSCVEQLAKDFDPLVHDALILDEADLSFMTRVQAIAFLDKDEPCTLHCRYKPFRMAPIRKVLISNPPPDELYPREKNGALAAAIFRRLTIFHITQPTYDTGAAPRAPLQALPAQGQLPGAGALVAAAPPLLPPAAPLASPPTQPTQPAIQGP